MHVSSSQSNTATQTDDKTHTERTAAAARILVVRAGLQRDTLYWPSNETALRIEVVGLSVQWLKHITPLDNKHALQCGLRFVIHAVSYSRFFNTGCEVYSNEDVLLDCSRGALAYFLRVSVGSFWHHTSRPVCLIEERYAGIYRRTPPSGCRESLRNVE